MVVMLKTWKLSKARAGMLSSKFFIMSHGPSPTPTKIIDNGYSLQVYSCLKNKEVFDNQRWSGLIFTLL